MSNKNRTGGMQLCVWVQTLFQSVTNGKEKFSRLLFCRLKSDCRGTLGTESVRILESAAQDPASVMAISSPYLLLKATETSFCTCLFLMYDCKECLAFIV